MNREDIAMKIDRSRKAGEPAADRRGARKPTASEPSPVRFGVVRKIPAWMGSASAQIARDDADLPIRREAPPRQGTRLGIPKWPTALGAASVQIVRESVDLPIGREAPTQQCAPISTPKWPIRLAAASVQIVRESVDWASRRSR
jgi:hypothetical protein